MGIRFGYRHVISNNLATHHPADLSKERHRSVLRQRAVLVDRIRTIITGCLTGSPAHPLGGTP